MENKLVLLNTTIATTDGTYEIKTIATYEVYNLLSDYKKIGVISAIGHKSTAEIMTQLLGRVGLKVEMNRITFVQEVGQEALVFKLLGRPEEGKILSVEEIEEIGYQWKVMRRTK